MLVVYNKKYLSITVFKFLLALKNNFDDIQVLFFKIIVFLIKLFAILSVWYYSSSNYANIIQNNYENLY